MTKIKSVEEYINNHDRWKEALQILHDLCMTTPLKATIKWGAPVYTINNKNIIGLGGFKNYVGIWFMQGVFLDDKHKKLINAQEGVTKALRQWRFCTTQEIRDELNLIKDYINEALINHQLGKELKPSKKPTFTVPDELRQKLENNSDLNHCFDKFSTSKKREFCEYISEAKKLTTKLNRIEKIEKLIIKGVGLNDKYRKK